MYKLICTTTTTTTTTTIKTKPLLFPALFNDPRPSLLSNNNHKPNVVDLHCPSSPWNLNSVQPTRLIDLKKLPFSSTETNNSPSLLAQLLLNHNKDLRNTILSLDKPVCPPNLVLLQTILNSIDFSHNPNLVLDSHFLYQFCHLLFQLELSDLDWIVLLSMQHRLSPLLQIVYKNRTQMDRYPIQFLIVCETWLAYHLEFTRGMASWTVEQALRYSRHPSSILPRLITAYSHHSPAHLTSVHATMAELFAKTDNLNALTLVLDRYPHVAQPILMHHLQSLSPQIVQILAKTALHVVLSVSVITTPIKRRHNQLLPLILLVLGRDPNATNQVVHLFRKLQLQDVHDSRKRKSRISLHMYNSVLLSLSFQVRRNHHVLSSMVNLCNEMKEKYPNLSRFTYDILIQACLEQDKVKDALSYFEQRHRFLKMQNSGLTLKEPSTTPPKPISTNGSKNPHKSKRVDSDSTAEKILKHLAKTRDFEMVVQFYTYLQQNKYPIVNAKALDLLACAFISTQNVNTRYMEFRAMCIDLTCAVISLSMMAGSAWLLRLQ